MTKTMMAMPLQMVAVNAGKADAYEGSTHTPMMIRIF